MKLMYRIGILVVAILAIGSLALQAVVDTDPPRVNIFAPQDGGVYIVKQPRPGIVGSH